MKFLVIALALVLPTFAYPDVSELNGYNYNHPSGNSLGSSSTQPSGSYLPGTGSNHYQSASQPSSNYIPTTGSSNNYQSASQPSGSYIPSSSSHYQASQPSGSYLPGAGGSANGASGHTANQDQKHVYFYAAPEDEAPARLKINVAANNNKNTRIIFIKAPSNGGVVPEIISPPSQGEDKTLVYVLVKKVEQGGQITIPSSVGTKEAKPEVYFIKYKNTHDAEKAVHDSLGGHSSGSSLPDLKDAQAFVRTIKDTPQNVGGGAGGNSGLGHNGLGGNGLGSAEFGSGLGHNGFGGSGSGNNGLGGSGSGYNYGPPAGSGPY